MRDIIKINIEKKYITVDIGRVRDRKGHNLTSKADADIYTLYI